MFRSCQRLKLDKHLDIVSYRLRNKNGWLRTPHDWRRTLTSIFVTVLSNWIFNRCLYFIYVVHWLLHTMYPQCIHNVSTMYPQFFLQCLYNVSTMFSQCIHNFPTMYQQCFYSNPQCFYIVSTIFLQGIHNHDVSTMYPQKFFWYFFIPEKGNVCAYLTISTSKIKYVRCLIKAISI